MEEIRVISGDKDGADLKREEMQSRYTIRCDGKEDNDEINDAISSVGSKRYLGVGDAWDRIFGDKK